MEVLWVVLIVIHPDHDAVKRLTSGMRTFYLWSTSDTTLVIATGEQRIYANILLTVGVVSPPK